MTTTNLQHSIKLAAGGAIMAALSSPIIAQAETNPFGMSDLGSGYMVADMKSAEGKCGEGKCGGDKKAKASGEGKCGEGKCGDDKKAKASGEGKCGEGKCGDSKR